MIEINKLVKKNNKGINRKIMAIGGGEILKTDLSRETRPIDKEIIRMSGHRHPRVLFIPTASHDAVGYCNNMLEYFGIELGCDVEFLLLYSDIDIEKIRTKINSAEIIYVGGGNTYAMMRRWRALGIDDMLYKAYSNGTTMSGLSAGAICWFRYGASDSRKLRSPDANMIKVTGLGFINAVFCPHFDSEPHREDFLKELMRKTKGPAIAVDDCCAIEIIDDKYKIISSVESANSYKVFWKNEIYHKEIIAKNRELKELGELISI